MAEQSMVERVAKAIRDSAVIVLDYSDVTYLEDPIVVARAAIGAMRIPTKSMMEEGAQELVAYSDTSAITDAGEAWMRMIDAALKD